MNRNSQLIVLHVSTLLNNATATRHNFALSQKRTSKSFQKYHMRSVPCFVHVDVSTSHLALTPSNATPGHFLN